METQIRIKHVIYVLIGLILLFLGLNYKSLFYGLSQLKGQVEILLDAQEIDEAMHSNDFPDSLKSKLEIVNEIKSFAADELGLEGEENYSTVYDQKGNDILWIVTACPEFELKAYEWSFPLFGSFPYKGFFEIEKAKSEEEKVREMGFDTNIRSVSGWSTLGFFRDPILSNMLYKSEADLANTIIHEMTHTTVFIRDQVDLNENLATFVGDYGALQFMQKKYSADHPKTVDYLNDLRQEKAFTNYVIQGAKTLDSLYSVIEDLELSKKRELKSSFIQNWVSDIDTLEMSSYKNFRERSLKRNPNNTFFMSYLRYNAMQNAFEKEFLASGGGDLKDFVQKLIKRYQ